MGRYFFLAVRNWNMKGMLTTCGNNYAENIVAEIQKTEILIPKSSAEEELPLFYDHD
jgi:hypothetical protein